jgi:hypothetical protein
VLHAANYRENRNLIFQNEKTSKQVT